MSTSRYTRRCAGPCQQVRGLSAFRQGTGCTYGTVCRWCREQADANRKAVKGALRRLVTIERKAQRLRLELRRLNAERRRLEHDAGLAVEPLATVTPPDPAQLSLRPRKMA